VVIKNTGGHTTINYVWGLGIMTNNEAKDSDLFKGISLALSTEIQRITICKDSMMIIKDIVNKNIIGGNIYIGVMSQILSLLKKFEDYSLYHIKGELNSFRIKKPRRE
jgi:ribonuclease HI